LTAGHIFIAAPVTA